MMDAVRRAVTHLDGQVNVSEHRITTREGLAMMGRLGVGNIPTICIDGQPRFVSIIPDQNTLVAALRERITAKALNKGQDYKRNRKAEAVPHTRRADDGIPIVP